MIYMIQMSQMVLVFDQHLSTSSCQVETGFLLDLPLKWISGWVEVAGLENWLKNGEETAEHP